MEQCDAINVYVDANKPWELAKMPANNAKLQEVCSRLLEAFRILTIYLKPVLPNVATQVEALLNIAPLQWNDVATPLPNNHQVNAYAHLMTRVETKMLDALFEMPPAAERRNRSASSSATQRCAIRQKPASKPLAPEIKIDDFAKIDLRIAKSSIANTWKVPTSCCA
jgi:methionyl-tRNA synthetase